MQRFVQHVDLDYHWFAGHGAQELGINDVFVLKGGWGAWLVAQKSLP